MQIKLISMKSKDGFNSMKQSLDSDQKKIKLLMIGDSGIGKTALVSRYVRNKFHQTYVNTIGIDFQQKQVKIEGKSVHLQIWDTAGQQRFHTITKAYYRGTEGIIIAFSLNNLQSFQQLEYWINQIEEEASSTCVKVLVGTKSDLANERSVDQVEIARFTERYDVKYIETSSKLDLNVGLAFETIAKEIFTKTKKIESQSFKMKLSLGEIAEEKKNDKISKKSRC